MIKRINITHLLESGKRLNPVDLIIHYRYRILTDKKITVSVWGTSNNKGYLCLGHQDLFRPTDFRDPLTYTKDFNTDIFQLKSATATGLFIFIDNAEYIEIVKIDYNFNEASKFTGREMECSPYYPPSGEVSITGYTINDGSIFSLAQTVILNNTCYGNPTHYRASKYIDFSDSDWNIYSTNPTFELYTIGVNTIYLQVKNSISTSSILSRQVAWHGYEELITSDTFVLSNVAISDNVIISDSGLITNIYIDDSFVLQECELNDEMSVFI